MSNSQADRLAEQIKESILGQIERPLKRVCEDVDALAALAKQQATPEEEPVEMSPEFTDTARSALMWVLWHHQGGSSKVGQVMRFALGMDQHERLSEHQIAQAKRWAAPHPHLAHEQPLTAPPSQAPAAQSGGEDPLLIRIEALEVELDAKQAELDEALHAPWPEWAKQVLKMTRELSGYDGYDDQDGINVAEEVREAYAELTSQIKRLRATPSPQEPTVAQAVPAGKYADVLAPFVALMERELHANSGKGDRPGWIAMSRQTAMLEIYYHVAKLQKAVKDNDKDAVREYGADVANMAMMAVDVCGALPLATPSQVIDKVDAEATFAGNALSWAIDRWIAEVSQRPLVNVHRRSLDDAWRQVMRRFGGDPDQLVGPSHDALLAATGEKP